MKANLTPGPEDGPERETLRAFLRHWHVPGPPPDIEEDLRRTFRRRRRSGRRPIVWLALAAGLALVALSQVVPRRPAPPERRVAVASPRPALPVPPESNPMASRAGVAAAPAQSARVRRAPVPSPTELEVIVEPGQAELLAQFGRELRTVQQEATGTTPPRIETVPADAREASIPQMPATDAPAYRATWETVAGEWPFMHRSVPDSGR
jgi:hypothetical protein